MVVGYVMYVGCRQGGVDHWQLEHVNMLMKYSQDGFARPKQISQSLDGHTV